MILIDSALIDFGEVCQRSVKTKYLTVGNNLNQYIHIIVNVSNVKMSPFVSNQYASEGGTLVFVYHVRMLNCSALQIPFVQSYYRRKRPE